MSGPAINIRPLRDDDLALVSSSWKRSLRANGSVFSFVKDGRFYFEMNRRVEKMLEDSTTLVAVHEHDDDAIIGWVCFDSVELHFIYVKEPYRYFKVATRLIEATKLLDREVVYATHWTDQAEKICQKERKTRVIFGPSRIGRKAKGKKESPGSQKSGPGGVQGSSNDWSAELLQSA